MSPKTNRQPPEEQPGGYVPPASPEAEQSVLGAILVRPNVLDAVADVLKPDDFYRQAHANIFKAMLDLYAYGQPVDLVTVTMLLRERGQLDAVGGPVFLATLSEQVGFATNADYYAGLVRDKAILRRLLDATQEVAGACFAPVENVAEFLDQAETRIFEITHGHTESKIESVGSLGRADYERTEAIYYSGQEDKGLYTGFPDIDRMTAGLFPGDLSILAARPSMGKTALALNVSWNVGYTLKEPVLFFSLEMSKAQLVRRLISSAGNINGDNLKRCKLTTDEWKKRSQIQIELDEAPIYIDDKPGITVLEVRARARRMKARHGLSLLVVDYLQLMGEPPRSQSRHTAVSHNSRKLKELAKELGVPVLALCQVSREIEKDKRKKYRLADLKESGDIEQDADNIWFIWRPQEETVAEVALAKQRSGPTGSLKLTYLPAITRFVSYQEEREGA